MKSIPLITLISENIPSVDLSIQRISNDRRLSTKLSKLRDQAKASLIKLTSTITDRNDVYYAVGNSNFCDMYPDIVSPDDNILSLYTTDEDHKDIIKPYIIAYVNHVNSIKRYNQKLLDLNSSFIATASRQANNVRDYCSEDMPNPGLGRIDKFTFVQDGDDAILTNPMGQTMLTHPQYCFVGRPQDFSEWVPLDKMFFCSVMELLKQFPNYQPATLLVANKLTQTFVVMNNARDIGLYCFTSDGKRSYIVIAAGITQTLLDRKDILEALGRIEDRMRQRYPK